MRTGARIKRATDDQIAQLLAAPLLVRPFMIDRPRRVGCLGRVLGMRPHQPDAAAPLPDDWPAAEVGDAMDVGEGWWGLMYLLSVEDWETEDDGPLWHLTRDELEAGGVGVGYAPARALTSQQVYQWAEALLHVSAEELEGRFDLGRMSGYGIDPTRWEEAEEALEYLLDEFGRLRAFVLATRDLGRGLVAWVGW